MKDKKPEYDWEVLPSGLDEKDEEYAIYIDRHEDRHPSLPDLEPFVVISNQSDCAETFGFGGVAELDAFMDRLKGARQWLVDNE